LTPIINNCFFNNMKKIILILGVLLPVFGFSQTITRSHTVTYTVNTVLELDFDNTAQNLGFTFASATDFESGKTNATAGGFRVRSNKPWTVSVKANAANFTATAGGETNVTANKLSVRKSGTTTWIALGTTDQTLSTGSKGGFGTNTFQIDYFANPGYIAPATYTLPVVYTVTAP